MVIINICIIISIIIFIIAWIGFAKYYHYKKNESWFWSVFVGCVLSCIILFICIVLSVGILSYFKPPTPPQSDKELYFTFYNDIVAHMNAFDDKIKPFQEAMAVRDPLEAINIASNIQDDVTQLWSKLQGVSVPDLKNKEAQKDLEQAKEYFSDSYFNKSQVLKSFVEYSKNPSPYLMAKVTKNSDQTQTLSLGGAAKLIAAGMKLGLSIDEIKNGGK